MIIYTDQNIVVICCLLLLQIINLKIEIEILEETVFKFQMTIERYNTSVDFASLDIANVTNTYTNNF